jgi:hypothetical protein
MIDLGSFLASHKSKIFLAHPPSGNPLMYLLDRDGAEKVVTFLNISQTKTSVGGLNKASFHHLRKQKKRGGVKKA